ncbi:MAG TPA: MAPEG family protein [Rhizomicrobium sp.]
MDTISTIFTDGYHIFALYAALNGLILLVLGLLVVRARVKTQTLIGDGGKPEMAGPLRAHGNNSEWTPMAIVLMLVLVSLGGPWWLQHVVGLPLTVGRLLHGFGLSRNTGTSQLRFAGMILTWLAYIFAIVAILWILFFPSTIIPSPDAVPQ